MENLSATILLQLYIFILVVLWVYFFTYSYKHKIRSPWGFSVVIIGILTSGIGYHFRHDQTTYFSLSIPFSICLFGIFWNINDIRSQLRIGSTNEFLRFVGIGLMLGLLFGFVVIAKQGLNNIQTDPQFTLIALITNSMQTSMAEEFLFRGYFLGYLRKYEFKQFFAIIFQSLMFTILHIPRYSEDWAGIFVIFLSGITAGYLTWKSNNLIPALILHITVNLIALIWWSITM